MDLSKHKVSVELQCPTCGGTRFSGLDGPADKPVTCVGCGIAVSRSDLIARNRANVNSGVKRLGKKVTEDIAKQLSKAFKGK